MILSRLLSRRWILATLIVAAGIAVTVRLGIWQLDRLEARRAFNAHFIEQANQPALELNSNSLDAGLESMEFRQVVVKGEYDHSQQIAVRNQYWEGQWGVHLITPLKIAATHQAILVDRGWIPGQDFQSGDWSSFDEPGNVEVMGIFRSPQSKAELGPRSDPTPAPGASAIKAWNFVHISAISQQVPYSLMPVYIQQSPSDEWTGLPYRSQPEIEISEGPHMGYAIQWFTFAAILAFGYPVYIRRQEKRAATAHPDGEPLSQTV